jgi:ParB family chromosome partitioning protein
MSKLSEKFAAGKRSLAERSALAERDDPTSPLPSHFVRSPGPLHGSVSTMKIDLLKGEIETMKAGSPVIKIPADQIRASRWVNRHEDSFKATAFQELKDEISSAGRNIQAIKVRPIEDEEFKYEIVFGHRRHRACLELGLDVYAEVAILNEESLFAEMDRENRQRADLRPYEQGMMYRRALDEGLFPSARKLAEALNVSNTNVSDVIALTKLPDVVLDAFSSRLDLQVRWVSLLNEAIGKSADSVFSSAQNIIDERQSGASLSAKDILSKLIQTPVKVVKQPRTIKVGGSKMAVIKESNGVVTVSFIKDKLSKSHIDHLEKFIKNELTVVH